MTVPDSTVTSDKAADTAAADSATSVPASAPTSAAPALAPSSAPASAPADAGRAPFPQPVPPPHRDLNDRLVMDLVEAVKAILRKEQSDRLRDVYLIGDIEKDTARAVIERIRELAN